jgi:hypothetical protein
MAIFSCRVAAFELSRALKRTAKLKSRYAAGERQHSPAQKFGQ